VLAQVESLVSQARGVDVAFRMDETRSARSTDRTARPLWAYGVANGGRSAVRRRPPPGELLPVSARGSRLGKRGALPRYLFRIATNLVNDHRWRRRRREVPLPEPGTAWEPRADTDVAGGAERLADRRGPRAGRAQAAASARLLLARLRRGRVPPPKSPQRSGSRSAVSGSCCFRARRRMAALLAESRPGGS